MSNVDVSVTTLKGQPAVSVKPKDVPKGNIGGSGTITVCESDAAAQELAKTLKEKYNNPQGDTFVSSQKVS
jgi:hypothetical protein